MTVDNSIKIKVIAFCDKVEIRYIDVVENHIQRVGVCFREIAVQRHRLRLGMHHQTVDFYAVIVENYAAIVVDLPDGVVNHDSVGSDI